MFEMLLNNNAHQLLCEEYNDPGESLLVGLCVCAASMGGHTHFHPAAPARSMALAPSATRQPASPPDRHTARRLTRCPSQSAAACCSSSVCVCCWSASREILRRLESAIRLKGFAPTPQQQRAPVSVKTNLRSVLFIRARAHAARARSSPATPRRESGLSL